MRFIRWVNFFRKGSDHIICSSGFHKLAVLKISKNEGLFMHIWINLLDNAIKFSPSKGTITMFLKQEQPL